MASQSVLMVQMRHNVRMVSHNFIESGSGEGISPPLRTRTMFLEPYLRISGYSRVIYFITTKTTSKLKLKHSDNIETEIEKITLVFPALPARPGRIWSF